MGSGVSVAFTVTRVRPLFRKFSVTFTSVTRSPLRIWIVDVFGTKCSGSSRYQVPEVSGVMAPIATASLYFVPSVTLACSYTAAKSVTTTRRFTGSFEVLVYV